MCSRISRNAFSPMSMPISANDIGIGLEIQKMVVGQLGVAFTDSYSHLQHKFRRGFLCADLQAFVEMVNPADDARNGIEPPLKQTDQIATFVKGRLIQHGFLH